MENFIVSARKYRPATFRSVVGQQHITSTLRNAISRGQLAHAYLFCGPRGVGKTTCARIFAKAINCMNPQEGGEACNACESCRSFNEGRSFNIHELDAASNNSVDDIRNLTDQVRIPPQVGRYSVYIIDEVHMLSAAAFNAFLKTLEEPPAHAIFILATTEKHKIIPTILSRCQIFDFNRIRIEDSVGYMKHIAAEEGVTYDDESLNLIARKADGGMRDALSMFDKAVSFCGNDLHFKEVAASLNVLDYDTYFSATDTLLSGDYQAALLLFDGVLQRGFSAQIFLSGLNGHMRDLLVCKNARTASLLEVTGTLADRYSEQAARCSVEFLFGAIELLTGLDASLRTSGNQRLLAELGLMKLAGLGQKKNRDGEVTYELPPLHKTETASSYNPVSAGTARSVASDAAPSTGHAAPATPSCNLTPTNPVPTGAVRSTASDVAVSVAAGGESSGQGRNNGEPVAEEPVAVSIAVERAPAVEESVSMAETVSAATKPVAAPIAETMPTETKPGVPDQGKPKRISVVSPLSSLSGRPLSDILGGKEETTEKGPEEEDAERVVDPECADKIEKFREPFLKALAAERPRIAVVFETMRTEGNTVRIRVASEALREEVLRNRTEVLSLLASVAGVNGSIELEVEVDQTLGAAKPIRPEDKLRYLTEQNSVVTDLRRMLDLEIE